MCWQMMSLLAKEGAVILCGGLTGVMEAVAKGAKEGGGISVGILPGFTTGLKTYLISRAE